MPLRAHYEAGTSLMAAAAAERRIMHVDADAFFVSVERVLEPSLRGRPVVVGGARDDRRGVVASASYEARACGVRSAMPISHAVRLCPEAVFLRGSRSAYAEFSRRIQAVLRSLCPLVQAVSLDDFYLDATGLERLHGPALELGRRIRRDVLEQVGVTVTVGIASNRLVAKVASESAKPDGLVEIPAGGEAAFLAPRPSRDLPGVGPAAWERLQRRGLLTLGSVAAADPALLERLFGKWGRALQRRARGEDDAPVSGDPEAAQSVSHETTFGEDVGDPEALDAALLGLVGRVCARLREAGLTARTFSVKVRFSDFSTVSAARTLPEPTCYDREAHAAASERLRHLLRPGWSVRLLGLAATNLAPSSARQADFLDPDASRRLRRLYEGIDAVRRRQGYDAIRPGRSVPEGPRATQRAKGNRREQPPVPNDEGGGQPGA